MSSALRVGVFDDSAMARLTTTRLLQRAHMETVEIQNWDELLQHLPQLQLLLLDVSLGDEDGREVARRLRLHEQARQLSRLPVIALTAHADEELVQSFLRAGYDDYLHKPFRPQQLYDKIQNWTASSGGASPS